MLSSKVYKKDEFWFVDFIDSNYEMLPSVGIFKYEEDAKEAARVWNNEEGMETLGQSNR